MRVTALRSVVLEVERHVADAGWDGAPRLFALADTVALLEAAPQLAESLGLGDGEVPPDSLTPVEQEVDAGSELRTSSCSWTGRRPSRAVSRPPSD